jgi:hypothetical protein
MVKVKPASNSKSGKVPSVPIIVLNIVLIENGTVTSPRASGQGRGPNHEGASQCSALEGGVVPDTGHPGQRQPASDLRGRAGQVLEGRHPP